MLRTLISAPAMPSEPQTSVFLQEQRQQIQSGTGIGREDPANVSGYIYRDDSPPAVPAKRCSICAASSSCAQSPAAATTMSGPR